MDDQNRKQASTPSQAPPTTPKPSVSTLTQGQQSALSQAPPTTPKPSVSTLTQGQQSAPSQAPPTTPKPSVSILTQGQRNAGAQPAHQSVGPVLHQMKTWKDCVQDWYPDLLQRAHFMPHVYMNRVLHNTVQVSGVDVSVPQSPVDTQHKGGAQALLHSDVRDDTAQQHVLHCLRKIAGGALSGNQPEVMFVLSQMNFGDYLNSPCYSSAASCLPRPLDLSGQGLSDGDFDVLVIHRQYGLMVGEIKAVGANAAQRGLSEQQLEDELLNKLRKMLSMSTKSQTQSKRKLNFWKRKKQQQQQQQPVKPGQLDKARKVLRHVTQDQPSAPRVTATLILPYITRKQLKRALATDDDVRQTLCQDLDIPVTADPTDWCLCQDQMSDSTTPNVFSSKVLRRLGKWWRACMSGGGSDPALTDDMYIDLVARFAGPASLVRVHCASQPRLLVKDMRTEGQAVSETHDRLTQLSLYPSQVDVLQQGGQLVYLTGPPGTGKSLMLMLEGMEWLRQNRHVYIASLWKKSRAASWHIYHQLMETARQILGTGAARRVHIHFLDMSPTHAAHSARFLIAAAKRMGELCVMADEADSVYLKRLFDNLRSSSNIQHLRLWAAGVMSGNVSYLDKVTLTDPLRCPPSVVREVGQADDIQRGFVPRYTQPDAPFPCDGPPVIYIQHKHYTHGHGGFDTGRCQECGMMVGLALKRMHVGRAIGTAIPAIRFRDVIVLTLYRDERQDAKRSQKGSVKERTEGFVWGLRTLRYPSRIVTSDDTDSIGELGRMTGPDVITVTNVDNVRGLERKVVVMLESEHSSCNNEEGRLHAMSRSTAQLIVVTVVQTNETSEVEKKETSEVVEKKETSEVVEKEKRRNKTHEEWTIPLKKETSEVAEKKETSEVAEKKETSDVVEKKETSEVFEKEETSECSVGGCYADTSVLHASNGGSLFRSPNDHRHSF